jgi:hypothetical protein
MFAQVAAFFLSAIVAATALFLWRRVDRSDRHRLWQLYGFFTGLCCVGSVLGAIAILVFMQSYELLFRRNEVERRYWNAAYQVLYGLYVPCLTLAKLMLLDRLVDFAVPKSDPMSKKLSIAGRFAFVVVVLVSVIAMCSAVALAVTEVQIGSALTGTNNSTAVRPLLQELGKIEAVQASCELVWRLISLLAYGLTGFLCARRVRAAMLALSQTPLQHHLASAAGKKLKRQIAVTTVFLFITDALRAAYAVWFASMQGGSNVNDCRDTPKFCSSCYNDWQLMLLYDLYTPELYLTVELIASPMSLLVALWGMTSGRMYNQLRSGLKKPLLPAAHAAVSDSNDAKL